MRWFIPTLLLAVACNGGDPTDAPDNNLADNTYRMQVGGLTVTGADAGLNTLVQGFFGNEVVFQFTNVTATSADMQMALGAKDTTPIERNQCWDVVDLTGVSISDGMVSFGPSDLSFPRDDGSTLDIDQVSFMGDVSDDGMSISNIVMTASLDVRIAAGSAFGDPQDLCDTMSGFNVTCGACGDGENFCVDLEITGLGAQAAEVEEGMFGPAAPEAGECDA